MFESYKKKYDYGGRRENCAAYYVWKNDYVSINDIYCGQIANFICESGK